MQKTEVKKPEPEVETVVRDENDEEEEESNLLKQLLISGCEQNSSSECRKIQNGVCKNGRCLCEKGFKFVKERVECIEQEEPIVPKGRV